MPASKHVRLLSVRLLDVEVRRLKTVAASRGVSLQQAVREAVEMWSRSGREPMSEDLNTLEGSLADVDVEKLRRTDKEGELSRELFLSR